MKKSVLSVGLLAILGGAWCGGAWYTGKITEQKYIDYIQFSNQRLQQSFADTGYSVQIKDAVLDRGFFSSNVHYQLEIKDATFNEVIPFVGKIYHGPITLNDFSFALFSADTEVEKTPETQAYFADNGKNPLRTVVRMSYGEALKGKIGSDVIYKLEENGEISWNITGKFNLNQEGYGKSEINASKFSFLDPKGVRIIAENVETEGDFLPTQWKNIYQGKSKVTIKKIAVNKDSEKEEITFDNINAKGNVKVKENFLDMDFDYDVKNISINNKPITGLKLAGEINHISADALNRLNELNEDNRANTQLFEQVQTEILANQPVLNITKLELFNDKGKALDGNLEMALNKDAPSLIESSKLFNAFNKFQINAKLEKKGVVQLATNLSEVYGHIGPEQEIENTIQHYFSDAEQHNLLVIKENNATFNLFLDKEKQKLIFNHQELSEKEVVMTFFLLMMNMR
ncbi:YdgA family protein [Avibacterium sp. 21-599]|uniref:YdgA family protein n=1 Tax=Avibacterium sp. 21-599 TaxID=2911528 RepID=UPI0022466D53|nr:YdgA family protein [Avibacterium sp. 21-599]MCW9718152.1 YdgA family protein [Avibacterium sp. 21-599]